ncbi:MAG: adaptor protein MecA, partial [Clostridia bacterium]|nr:adaptor protein MecA [Clostridia bacterium]
KEEKAPTPVQTDRIFRMDSIQAVMSAAKVAGASYYGESALYKEDHTGKYLLILSQGEMTSEEFNKISNVLSEYGSLCKNLTTGQSYLEEHYAALIRESALQSLSCSTH